MLNYFHIPKGNRSESTIHMRGNTNTGLSKLLLPEYTNTEYLEEIEGLVSDHHHKMNHMNFLVSQDMKFMFTMLCSVLSVQ